MSSPEAIRYDVLIVGAGGAGLRAAIEAAQAGVSVGLICKSLLGKAHTVMAEGGVAAAMGYVDDRDDWRVHFTDTMRGGQYINNWRMAELHAREAPERVRELEAWGALFDRTADGRILQRNFGGHRYPRLAHVGDRTGLEMIRTLQDHGIHQGIDVHMEVTVATLFTSGGRIAGQNAAAQDGRLRIAASPRDGGIDPFAAGRFELGFQFGHGFRFATRGPVMQDLDGRLLRKGLSGRQASRQDDQGQNGFSNGLHSPVSLSSAYVSATAAGRRSQSSRGAGF